MKFLCCGFEGMLCSTAYRLMLEGNDVRMFIANPESREHLDGMVAKASSLADGLKWVGQDGCVLMDDEADATPIRRQGLRVLGGNKLTERMEKDRAFQLGLCQDLGITVPKFKAVKSVDEAIAYILKHPDAYALKQQGQLPKQWSYIGKADDGSDVVEQLRWFKQQPEYPKVKNEAAFLLQEVADGIEFGCGAFWQYRDWKRRDDGSVFIELNKEHKKAEEYDRGLTCGEAGTVMQFTDNMTLFEQTLDKLTPWLQERCGDVCLNIDANCGLVDEGGDLVPYLYELTLRCGYPAITLQEHLLDIEAGKFYSDLLNGAQGEIAHKDGWAVVAVLGSGQYPQETITHNHEGSFKDQPVEMELSDELWPLYVKQVNGEPFYRVADYYEMVCAAVADSADILEASSRCTGILEQVNTRAPHFRSDIGHRFVSQELTKLEEYGYVDARRNAIA